RRATPRLSSTLCHYSYRHLRDLHSFPTRRSSDLDDDEVSVRPERGQERLGLPDASGRDHRHDVVHDAGVQQPGDGPHEHAGAVEDRKSTRLNSSHVSISYAVFCLKKKSTKDRTVI